jgi:CzcA family heavy metal efflux pump
MDLAGFSIRHARAIVFLAGALSVLGVWAYVRTPASIFPEIPPSRIDVVADAGNLPPEQVRVTVTMPLEQAFLGLRSVRRVVATSAQGSAEIDVEFDPHTDIQADLQLVDSAISQTRAQLPAATDGGVTVVANIVAPQTEPILSFAFTSRSLSQTLVREYIERNVVPVLYGTPGLARVLVAGGTQREYHVDLDGGALAASGLSARDVGDAIAQANDVEAVGIGQQYSQRQAVLVDARLRDAAQLAAVIVPTRGGAGIPVGSLGAVRLGVAPLTSQVSFDATHAVALNAYALPGTDNVRMAREIEARLATVAARLPRDIEPPHLYWDATDLIVASQTSLRDAVFIGALLALAVIFLFLRNLRMTLVAAIVIPAAMSIAVLAIASFGETLNLMSVGGLAIAVGLIIDDAIVVVEGIARTLHEQPELSMQEAVIATMRRLIGPMTASTLTTVVVFVPLGLLGGVAGAFFRALALTLTCALIVSLGLALFLTPILFRTLLGRHVPHGENERMRRVLDRYEPVLDWALRRRGVVFAIAGCVLVVTIGLIAMLPSDFLPHLDEGQFEIAYSMPVGTPLAASDAAGFAIERAVSSDPAVSGEGRFTGIDTNGFSPTPPRSGIVRVKLKPLGERPAFEAIGDRLRDAIAAVVPAAQLDVHQILEDVINDISGTPAPIEIVLTGNDQSVLVQAATRVAREIATVPGVADAFSGVRRDDPTLRIAPDFQRLQRSGTDSSALAAALAAQTQGSVATRLAAPTMLVPVRVAVAGRNDALPAALSLAGGQIPLSQVARASVDRSSTDVTEIDGRRAILVTANTSGGNLSSTIAGVRAAIARAALPPGYAAEIAGAHRAQQESFKQFAEVIAIALVLVFFVMLSSFRSFRQPLIILAAVPLAPIGVALGLTLTHTAFNVSSFMGLLLLVGLVVKNGILLIDATNRNRADGLPVKLALVRGAQERLRPILMTTLAAICGLLPLAFGIGAGAAMERPLAIAVVGGLSTATLFTLVLIPVLYAAVAARETEPAS